MMSASLLLSLLLLACAEAPEAPPPSAELSARVRWEPLAPAQRVVVATLAAEVVPAPNASARLGPGVSGRLTRWLVAPGATVRAGDPLAELQSAALTTQEGAVVELAAAVTQAQGALDARRAEQAAGVGRAVEVQAAEAALTRAQAALESARGALSAQRDTVSGGAGARIWRAPRDGAVQALHCAPGPLRPEDVCVTLVRPEDALLRVSAPERVDGALDHAPRLRFFPGDTSAPVEATLTAMSPALNPNTRARELWFTAPAGALTLGQSGRAELVMEPEAGLFAVPSEGAVRLEGGLVVLVKDAAEPLGRPVPVVVVGTDGDAVVVRGEGLAPGDEIATRGAFLLKSMRLLAEEG